MEDSINWLAFLRMMPFILFGLFVYILAMLVLAQKNPKFDKNTFFARNKWAWLLSLCYSLIGCYLFIRGFGEVITENWSFGPSIIEKWDVLALFTGLSGGSLGKISIKLLLKGKRA